MDIAHIKLENQKWKLEFWKGIYGVLPKCEKWGFSNGCEIGLYYKDGKKCKCAYQKERRLHMIMSLYIGKKKLFTRDSEKTTEQKKAWWLTAFKPRPYLPGKKTVSSKELRTEGKIYLFSNYSKYRNEMNDFIKKIGKSGSVGSFSYTIKNGVMRFSW